MRSPDHKDQVLARINELKAYCQLQQRYVDSYTREKKGLQSRLRNIEYHIAKRNPETDELDEEGSKLVNAMYWNINFTTQREMKKILSQYNQYLRSKVGKQDPQFKKSLEKAIENIDAKISELSQQKSKDNLADLDPKSQKTFRDTLHHHICPIARELAKIDAEKFIETIGPNKVIHSSLLNDLEKLKTDLTRSDADPTPEQKAELEKIEKKLNLSTSKISKIVNAIPNIGDDSHLPVLEPKDFQFAYGSRRGLEKAKQLTIKVNKDLEEIKKTLLFMERQPDFSRSKNSKLQTQYQKLKTDLAELKKITHDINPLLPAHPESEKYTRQLNKLLNAIRWEEASFLSKPFYKKFGRKNPKQVQQQSFNPDASKPLNEEKVLYLWTKTQGEHGEVIGQQRVQLNDEHGDPLKLPSCVIHDAIAEFNQKHGLKGRNAVTIRKVYEKGKVIDRIEFPKHKQQEFVKFLTLKGRQYAKEKEGKVDKAKPLASVKVDNSFLKDPQNQNQTEQNRNQDTSLSVSNGFR